MIGNNQLEEIVKRVKKELDVMVECSSIKEISEKTNIPRSTVQRDLNNKDLIVSLSNEEVYEKIQEWLKKSKELGLSKGGTTSQNKYTYERDELGHFKGVK